MLKEMERGKELTVVSGKFLTEYGAKRVPVRIQDILVLIQLVLVSVRHYAK